MLDPKGPDSNPYRTFRGGCFGSNASALSHERKRDEPGARQQFIGLRIVRNARNLNEKEAQ